MKKKKLTQSTVLVCLFQMLVLSHVFAKDRISRPPKDSRPNILFIVSEDNGMEIGCYGAPVSTPVLDDLAKQGVRFANSYVPQAGCSPSRAAFLTGLYPHQNGQVGLATWKYAMYNPRTPNIVNVLKKSGYRTGMVGKLHVNPVEAFDIDFHKVKEGNFKRQNMERYANFAASFIRASDEPFYLQVNYPDAHDPFIRQVDGLPANPLNASDVAPLPYMGVMSNEFREKTANYYNSIMRLDALIGILLDSLKASGKYDNTLIVYIGDHGADMLRGKRTSYEGGTRIPMIMVYPKNYHQGSVYQGLVSTIDLFPTFLAASGQTIPSYLPGVSLMDVMQGKEKPVRKYLFTEYNVHSNHNPYPQRAVRNDRYKLIHNLVAGKTNPGYAYTNGLFQLTDQAIAEASPEVRKAYKLMSDPPEFELYDLVKDPFEWNNLAADSRYKKVVDELRNVLTNWQKETQDPMLDKKIAERFFDEIMASKNKKIDISYHQYMDPKLIFKGF